jgi:ATP-dependent RNA helicase DDX5/DBP2
MGQDYVARKARKKQRKRMSRGEGESFGGGGRDRDRGGGDDGAPPAAARRVRKKANQPRRNCRGLCHQPAPIVTRDDLRWDGRAPPVDGQGGGGNGGDNDDADLEAGARGDVFFGGGPDDPLSPADAAAEKYRRAYERRTGVKVAPAPGEEADNNKKKEQPKKKKKQKMTTGVRLLSNEDLLEGGGGGNGASAAAPAKPPLASSPSSPIPPLLRPFPPTVGRAMAVLGHEEPTPVQSAAWPVALKGRDLVAVAPTGSGKTLAFLLPAVVRALKEGASASAAEQPPPSAAAPLALVLTPTRELAQQVFAQAKAACRAVAAAAAMEEGQQQGPPAPPRACAVFGGAPLAAQAAELAAFPPAVLVATPGRLLALADLGSLCLSRVACAVLDEADRMLDAGFAPQLERLAALLRLGGGSAAEDSSSPPSAPATSALKRRPQVLLFTATMPDSVAAAARCWTRDGAARVDAEGAAAAALAAVAPAAADPDSTTDPEAAPAAAAISPTVSQVAHVCADHKKPAKLLKHLRAVRQQAADAGKGRSPPRVLVFVNRIKTAVALRRALAESPVLTSPMKSTTSSDHPPAAPMRVEALHGARPQSERDAAVAAFRAGKCHVLVATDVASRGLDVKGLPYVVNYDCPVSLESYAHRVGRTGRLAARGHAYTFLTRAQARLAPGLVAVLTACGQPLDPNLAALAEAWSEVERRLGPAAARAQGGAAAAGPGEEEEGEEEEGEVEEEEADEAGKKRPAAPEDLHEGLQQQQQQQERQLRKAQEAAVLADVLGLPSLGKLAKRRAARAATGEDVMLVPSRPAGGATTATAPAANGAPLSPSSSQQAPPNNGAAFVRSPRFRGAMQGYVFRRGDQGVGYYVDAPPLSALQAAMAMASGARPATNGDRKAQKKAQQKQKAKSGLAALPKLPGLARRAADDDDDDDDDDSGGGGGGGGWDSDGGDDGALYRKAPPPPRKRAKPDSDDDSDDSDSDDGGRKKKYKGALPGRLRKKLAKQRGGFKGVGAGGAKAGKAAGKAGGGGIKKGGGGGRGAYNAGTSKGGGRRRV